MPIAGVAGRLLSRTVSSELLPPIPRPGVRIPERIKLSSSSGPTSKLETELGTARSTTMLGVCGGRGSVLRGECSEGRIDKADGGGDFKRSGAWPAEFPLELYPLLDFCGRGSSVEKSGVAGDCSCGVPVIESALWMAAAEGTVGMLMFDVLVTRLGLKSWLFFLDLDNFIVLAVPGLRGGRTGDTSRDGRGDADVERGVRLRLDVRGVVDARCSGCDGDDEAGRSEEVLAVLPLPLVPWLARESALGTRFTFSADISPDDTMVEQ